MDEKKKKIIISISLIVVLILIVTGISYAAFRFVGQGNKVNQITTGTISMNYKEGTNVIRLNNALPTTDETGMTRLVEGEYFDFSVTTNITGNAVINWEIAAEDFEDNTFDGANVKFYLTKLEGNNEIPVSETLPRVYNEEQEENVSTGRPTNMMSLLTGSTSTQGEEITDYRLRLYVDENYNPQGDGGGLVFKTRINTYGKVSTKEEPTVLPIMKTYQENTSEDYHNSLYKNKITNISTKSDVVIPTTALALENGKGNYWDVSAAGDDSVIAYLEDDATGNETYRLTIGGNGGIEANQDSSHLFQSLQSLIKIDFGNFDTRNVVSMNYMFAYCNELKNINLDVFDTSNVTDMSHMFHSCLKLSALDLSNFNTSKVTSFDCMFVWCSSLITLDLSNFDTSNVTNMECMFEYCSSLTNLTINSFNTSNVTDMSCMFNACRSLTNIDLSNFDTSSVTDMSCMFMDCGSLTTLNVGSFNTSNVTEITWIFKNCTNLVEILVSNQWTTEHIISDNPRIFENCGTDHVTVI